MKIFKIIFAAFLVFFTLKVEAAQDIFKLSTHLQEANPDFYRRFNDPYLENYVKEAITNNKDLRSAAYKVEQSRLDVRYSLSSEMPSISMFAQYVGAKAPDFDNLRVQKSGFALPFIFNYESDILLKNRDKTRALKYSAKASTSEQKALTIALLSDLTSSYINLISYDALIKNNNRLLEIDKKQLEALELRYQRGIISKDVLRQGVKTYENQKAELIKLNKERKVFHNSFLLYLSKTPENQIKRKTFENFNYNGALPNFISSDVIYSRPDVQAAEAKLKKAKIDVRVARKELLPKFNIFGILAFNSLGNGSFFSWENSLAALLAGASMDLFKGGAKITMVKLQKAKYEELFENYKQVDLKAIKEVNDALWVLKYDSEYDLTQIKNLKIEENNYADMQRRYNQGTISIYDLRESEKKLIAIKNLAINSKTQRLVDYISLYKATGANI